MASSEGGAHHPHPVDLVGARTEEDMEPPPSEFMDDAAAAQAKRKFSVNPLKLYREVKSRRGAELWEKLKKASKTGFAMGEFQFGKMRGGAGSFGSAALILANLKRRERLGIVDEETKDEDDPIEQSIARRLRQRLTWSETQRSANEPAEGGGATSSGASSGARSPGQVALRVEETELTSDHMRLLYLIHCYTGVEGQEDAWIRRLPLLVLVYEGIVDGVFSYDYAPAREVVDGSGTFVNISQEGKDQLDDLRDAGYISGLKLSSKKYTSTISLRISMRGKRKLEKCMTSEDREAVESFIYAPKSMRTPEDKLTVRFEQDDDEGYFVLFSESGYERDSSITEIESVSYVSSPFLPESLRNWGRNCSSNSMFVHELKGAASTVKDDLDENITLDNVRMLLGEFIPMGSNQLVSLNEKVGSSERVQGGFFTNEMDHAPDRITYRGVADGLSEVEVLDYDEATYINIEAEVHFEESAGVVQRESFGIHANYEGFCIYACRVDGVMHAVTEQVSLDNLSRVLVDISGDSSNIVDNLVSSHQRSLLDLVYLGDAQNREKYALIMASNVNDAGDDPRRQKKAEFYLDKGQNENEIKQVLGDTYAAHDVDGETVLIIGRNGTLISGPYLDRFEATLLGFLKLMSMNMFMRSLFQRIGVLTDGLRQIREMIDVYEEHPESIGIIRNMLSDCSADIILLNEIQSYMAEALEYFDVPDPPADPTARKLANMVNLGNSALRLQQRVNDMKKNIDGASGEVNALRDMADNVSKNRIYSVYDSVKTNTKSLEDVFRANERQSASLEIMQVVLAGSLAFEIFDRAHCLYLGVAAEVDWANDNLAAMYKTPMVLFIINMGMWGVVGGFVKWLLAYYGDIASGVLSVRYKLNVKVNRRNLLYFLADKEVPMEDINGDKGTMLKKHAWSESDNIRWCGEPPKIEVLVDHRFNFLLEAYIVISTKKSKVREKDILDIFFGELREYGVITKDAKIKGIEYFPEQEEEERLAAEEAALEAAKSVNLQQLLDAEFSGPSADDMARSLEQMKRDANMSMTVDRALWLGAEEEEEEQ